MNNSLESKQNNLSKTNNRIAGVLSAIISYKEFGVLITLITLCIVIGLFNNVFFTTYNAINVLRQISVMGIIAVGQAFVIISGGIDLSVGSFLSLGGVLAAYLCQLGVNAWLALVLTLGVGFCLGTLTGVIVVKLKINPFIATLAMLNIVRGFAYLITQGMPINFQTEINFIGEEIGGLPVPIILMFAIVILGHILLAKTVFGRYVFAVGGNERAAKLSGIQVSKIKLLVYSFIGTLATFTGIITAANLRTADTAAGQGYELDVIAATVIGGASLSGGRGSVIGVLIGAAILGVLRNGFVLLHVSSYWQMISIGIVIILACTFDELKRNRD